MTVHGASLTVRALWTQPRGGAAYVVHGGADANLTNTRPLGERWRERSVTVVLPATGQ